MCKLHGVRFIKGIKIFEGMLKNLLLLLTKRPVESSRGSVALALLLCSVVKFRVKNAS